MLNSQPVHSGSPGIDLPDGMFPPVPLRPPLIVSRGIPCQVIIPGKREILSRVMLPYVPRVGDVLDFTDDTDGVFFVEVMHIRLDVKRQFVTIFGDEKDIQQFDFKDEKEMLANMKEFGFVPSVGDPTTPKPEPRIEYEDHRESRVVP